MASVYKSSDPFVHWCRPEKQAGFLSEERQEAGDKRKTSIRLKEETGAEERKLE